MQELVSIFLIGVSLSMDTFSLSLSMGALIKNKQFLTLFPFVVALFHFIMPLIGNKIGITIMNCFNIASNIVLGLILIILGVNLAIQFFKKEEINININHPWKNKELKDLKLPKDNLIVMIKRDGGTIIPRGNTMIKYRDVLLMRNND